MNKDFKIDLNDPKAWAEVDWNEPEVPALLKKTDASVNRARANRLRAMNPESRERWLKAVVEGQSKPEAYKRMMEGKKRFWDTCGIEHRQHIAERSRAANLDFASPEQAEEIFIQCWGPDRGEKLYQHLAKQYGVSFHGIINLVRGCNDGKAHIYCPVDINELEDMKRRWEEEYKVLQIEVISPGSDMLDEYDRLYLASDQHKKVKEAWKRTLPSVVYHCRFEMEEPTPSKIRDYCDSIGIPRIKNDLGQYKDILNQKWCWLTDQPSQRWIFESYEELAEFLTQHTENIEGRPVSRPFAWEKVQKVISFRDCALFAGWIFRTI